MRRGLNYSGQFRSLVTLESGEAALSHNHQIQAELLQSSLYTI